MGLLRKQKAPEEPSAGRRRPAGMYGDEQRPQAFSYYAQRSAAPGRSERQPVDETIALDSRPIATGVNRFSTYAIGAVILAGAIAVTYLGSNPKIIPVTSHGSAYFMQNPSVYQQTAARTLSGSLLNHSKLTVDTAKVSNELRTDYPELATAAVTVPFIGTQPVIKVSPYQPSLMLMTAAGGVYLLDTNGRALVSSSQITDNGELDVPAVQDPGISDVRLGSQVLSAVTVNFIREVTVILGAANVDHGSMTLPAGTSELDVRISGKPYFVKFNLQDDPRQQTGTFLAVKQRLEHDKATPAEYIDVRVLGRAYYK